jgi:hypothetical protein
VTHLGHRLSALIDGELESSERQRVLYHTNRCGSCSDELAALWTLKRRVNAIGEVAAEVGLTAGLMSHLLGLDDSGTSAGMPRGETFWPPPQPPGGWPVHRGPSQDARPVNDETRAAQRAGRYFLTGSLVIFLAGLGTAAVIAGGEPQARAPAPPATPSIDVLVAPHSPVNPPTGPSLPLPRLERRLRPAVDATSLPSRP